MIGRVFKNSANLDFIVEKLERVDSNHKKYYRIKFLESGYITNNVRSDTIKSGLVRDKSQKTLLGIASIGNVNTRNNWKYYKLWSNIIHRCYDPYDKSFRWYGEKGVSVSDDWLVFENFLHDIKLVKGYDDVLFKNGDIVLDKDINSKNGNKIYSLATCEFVSNTDNQRQKAIEQHERNVKVAVFPDGHEEIISDLIEFINKNNLNRENIYGCLNGHQKTHKKFKFYYK